MGTKKPDEIGTLQAISKGHPEAARLMESSPLANRETVCRNKLSQKHVRRLWSKKGSLRVATGPEAALTAGIKSQGGEGRDRKSRERE